MFMKVLNLFQNTTTIKLKEGMILSNEPGYYKKGNHYGIRIENLIYIKKYKNNLKI